MHNKINSLHEVTSFSVAVAVEKQQRFFVDNLMLGVQFADISTRCSSHPQSKRFLFMHQLISSVSISNSNILCGSFYLALGIKYGIVCFSGTKFGSTAI